MLFLKHSDLNWNYSLKHDMQSGVHNDLPSNLSADVIFARIESGHTLSKHYHQRPLDIDGRDNGYESFFFFDGGHILAEGNTPYSLKDLEIDGNDLLKLGIEKNQYFKEILNEVLLRCNQGDLNNNRNEEIEFVKKWIITNTN